MTKHLKFIDFNWFIDKSYIYIEKNIRIISRNNKAFY
jgi:hypothetical protein